MYWPSHLLHILVCGNCNNRALIGVVEFCLRSHPHCSEHQELARLIQEQADLANPSATADLEAELSCVVDRLESKLEQIQVVKSMLSGMRHRGSRGGDRHHSVAPSGGKIAGAKKHASIKNAAGTTSSSSIGSQASLEMLRKMKTVQQRLERDDLSWD